MSGNELTRRRLLRGVSAFGLVTAAEQLLPRYLWAGPQTGAVGQSSTGLSGEVIDLTIAETPFRVGGKTGTARTINATLPGPLIRLREGQDVTLNVTNRMKVNSSIHWHGVLVPHDMDGVPGVAFPGIAPGETFQYRFHVRQYGTYFYHSHSPGQLQEGVYAPLIIDPARREPYKYDRDLVIMLSDWTFLREHEMIGRLKKQPGYFNFQQRTMPEFFSDVRAYGIKPTWDNYRMWARMRMDPTDLQDVTGHTYTYLMNGLPSAGNWTGLFTPGERVRLRIINISAMTFHDVRIPGLKMTVVQADGQNIHPVEVDEFRAGPAESYDVIVEPEDRAYTIFSEALDRSGYVRGTLAPRPGMTAEIPPRRSRPLRTMEDMGMSMAGMDMSSMKLEMDKNMKAGGKMMDMSGMKHDMPGMKDMPGMTDMPGMKDMPGTQHEMPGMAGMVLEKPPSGPVMHNRDSHGTGNQSIPMETRSRWDDPGIGLGGENRRVLVYADLKALDTMDKRPPARELEIHLTGHMERFMWSLDGKKFSEAREPIYFRLGERLRWTFINDTMMEHTMHLHGMFMELENPGDRPGARKHTVLVKPAERIPVLITPDERGPFAFHCHLDLHMAAGMFRVVFVADRLPETTS